MSYLILTVPLLPQYPLNPNLIKYDAFRFRFFLKNKWSQTSYECGMGGCLNLLIVLYFTIVFLLGIVEAMDIIIISIQIC